MGATRIGLFLFLPSPLPNSTEVPKKHGEGMYCFPLQDERPPDKYTQKGLSHSYSPEVKIISLCLPFSLLLSCYRFSLENLKRLCQPYAIRSRSFAESFSFSLRTIFLSLIPSLLNAGSSKAPEEKQSPSPKIYRLPQACEHMLQEGGFSVCF